MASSVSRQDELKIPRYDWLPERARSGLPAVSHKKNFPESQIINSLLTKLFQSRWLDIDLVLFLHLNSVPVHKHTKKELGQYPSILTSHLINNPYIVPSSQFAMHDVSDLITLWSCPKHFVLWIRQHMDFRIWERSQLSMKINEHWPAIHKL